MSSSSTRPHHGATLDTKDGLSVIACTDCGFSHITPLPDSKELTQLYEKEFYEAEKPNYFADAEEDLAWWTATYDNYLNLLEKHTTGRRILDVGSGPGYFVSTAKKRGWEAQGVEPSPHACAYARKRGLNITQGFFSYELLKNEAPFYVIHASMVLEHVPDPIGMIEEMQQLLTPGGILALFSPNDYNPLQEIARAELKLLPWWVAPRHHLNYFSTASMRALLERKGCEILESLATFPLEFFLLSDRNYVKDPSLGRGAHHARTAFEEHLYRRNPELLNGLYRDLATRGLGREFYIIARTPR